jgi:anaerobic magnesium-protoporphyrin IX monomethyl ester cyclase
LIDSFEMVMDCRWPTVQDIALRRWARSLLQGLSSWRYRLGFYHWPLELELAQKVLRPRKPKVESV